MNTTQVIKCGGFGAHTWYEKNAKHCKNIGATKWCEHCHKAMDENAGYLVNWRGGDDSLYPINGEQFILKLVGNECIKHFLTKSQYTTYAIKVNA